jgi:low temperature requirement protein LtrA
MSCVAVANSCGPTRRRPYPEGVNQVEGGTTRAAPASPAPATGARPRRRLPVALTVHDWDDETRHATWLELFFDLVFVAALANIGGLLHHDPTAGGAATAFGLLVPIWWAWISFSYFADLFDDDTPLHRVVQLAAMLGAIVLAVTLTDGVGDDGHLFAATFAAMFALLAAMYAVTGRTEPRAAELCRWYATGSAVGAVLWATSAVVPAPGRYWLWGVAVVANAAISGPIAYSRMRQPPVQVSHMPERFGLFAIVVLGEAVLSVVRGVDATDWAAASTATAVAGFVIAAGMWWIYFSGFDEQAINRAIAGGRASEVRSFVYGYGQVLVYGAVVAVGVAVQIAIERAAAGEHPPPILGWGVAALIVSFLVVGLGRGFDWEDPTAIYRVSAAKVVLALASIGVCLLDVPVAAAAWTIALGWVALVVYEMRCGVIPGWPAQARSE